jgi:glycosyltransferase involved in cell wall biosynthesis
VKITIIIPVFNGATTLERTLRSLDSQVNVNLECILVDGASSDDTLSIAYSFKSLFSQIISEPDNGLYSAINKGIKIPMIITQINMYSVKFPMLF